MQLDVKVSPPAFEWNSDWHHCFILLSTDPRNPHCVGTILFEIWIIIKSEFWSSDDRQTDRQTDGKRCIYAHRAVCTAGLKNLFCWVQACSSLDELDHWMTTGWDILLAGFSVIELFFSAYEIINIVILGCNSYHLQLNDVCFWEKLFRWKPGWCETCGWVKLSFLNVKVI